MDDIAYYAVCNAGGPISVRLGESESDALVEFAALDGRGAIDDARTDIEDDLDICGAEMSEDQFAATLEDAGARRVESLESPHIVGGWTLWLVEDLG